MTEFVLPSVVSDWTQEQIVVAGQTLNLTIPADPDSLLDNEEIHAENKIREYIPYWGYLWPAARDMAQLVAQARALPGSEPAALTHWPAGTPVLELGCGSGLIGLAGLLAGMEVTFSDYRHEALHLAGYNAVQNRLGPFQTLHLDWLNPPELTPFPWVIASDVLYERPFHAMLLDLFPHVVACGGELWIGDPGRSLMVDFVRELREAGRDVSLFDAQGHPCLFPRAGQFHLIVLKNTLPSNSHSDRHERR